MIRTKIKKINPERSNKMIYAVAAGLGVVLIVFFTLTIIGGRGGDRKSLASTLAYLKNTEGLVEIQAVDAEKKALIVFNSDSKNAGNFEKIAYYAALRLSRHWPDCEVLLAKNVARQIVYSIRVRNGAIAGAGPVASPTAAPKTPIL
ncbi:MAG: hypothetical protein L6428_02705 [Candidatus Aminicenantes bacterium]|nr:hypothetical protein [Acidobacteriota bacterium]MCG2810355.1 hypothetical protein [Candidatus Aminicenantes bacterium]